MPLFEKNILSQPQFSTAADARPRFEMTDAFGMNSEQTHTARSFILRFLADSGAEPQELARLTTELSGVGSLAYNTVKWVEQIFATYDALFPQLYPAPQAVLEFITITIRRIQAKINELDNYLPDYIQEIELTKWLQLPHTYNDGMFDQGKPTYIQDILLQYIVPPHTAAEVLIRSVLAKSLQPEQLGHGAVAESFSILGQTITLQYDPNDSAPEKSRYYIFVGLPTQRAEQRFSFDTTQMQTVTPVLARMIEVARLEQNIQEQKHYVIAGVRPGSTS
jgi:hypothetical protein